MAALDAHFQCLFQQLPNLLAHPGVVVTASRCIVSVRTSFSPPRLGSPQRKNIKDLVRHSLFRFHLALLNPSPRSLLPCIRSVPILSINILSSPLHHGATCPHPSSILECPPATCNTGCKHNFWLNSSLRNICLCAVNEQIL